MKEPFYATYFGLFGLRRGDRQLDQLSMRSRQAAKLLSILIYHWQEPYSIAKLIDMLWPGTAEDPTHALSNLVYRLRKILAAVWPGEELILSDRGTYQWNPAVPVETDVWIFDECQEALGRAEDPEADGALRERLHRVYQGRFLEEFSDDFDIFSLQTYYHNLYLKETSRLIDWYEACHAYEKMETLCQEALRLDPLDERLHCGMLQAYIGMNRLSAAESYYRDTKQQLQGYLGGAPSGRMQAIYTRMQDQIHARETDLERVLEDMNETEATRQVFFVEYGFFQNIYRLQCRLREREPYPVSVVLLSVYAGEARRAVAPEDEAVERLKSVLLSGLRHGDAVTRYSGSQYLVMLNGCAAGDVPLVMERIYRIYYQDKRHRDVQLQYSARELD